MGKGKLILGNMLKFIILAFFSDQKVADFISYFFASLEIIIFEW